MFTTDTFRCSNKTRMPRSNTFFVKSKSSSGFRANLLLVPMVRLYKDIQNVTSNKLWWRRFIRRKKLKIFRI
jgi:hypothetical protein